jgi:putative transposase
MRGFRDEFSEAAIKTVTITIHKDGRVTASLLMDYTPILPQCTDASYVGIDVGIRKFATDSNNTQHEPLDLSSTIASIKKLQRSIDRQTQAAMTAQEVTSYKHIAPSNNMVRTRTAIAKLYQKLINKRDNYIHHVANTYLGYRIVYVEDLQITDLLASFIGTIDSPNLMSRRDKRLHNLIASQSWGKFYSILEYKLAARGSKLVKVPPAYTSQMCSSCGTIDKKSRDGESYHCRHCGYTADADHNAAMNIAHIGRTTVFRLDEAA